MIKIESRNCGNYRDSRRAFVTGFRSEKPYKEVRWMTWQRYGASVKFDQGITDEVTALEKFDREFDLVLDHNKSVYGMESPYKRCGGLCDEIKNAIRA